MSHAAPLRFLAGVVGCWIGLRVIVLTAGGWIEAAPGAELPPEEGQPRMASADAGSAIAQDDPALPTPPPAPLPLPRATSNGRPDLPPLVRAIAARSVAFSPAAAMPPAPPAGFSQSLMRQGQEILPAASPPPYRLPPQPDGRWSASGWLFLRDGGGAALAPGGTLGASQAGLRVSYRLADGTRSPLALSGRLYMPLDRPEGAEAAFGLDWQPSTRVPLHILAERRERLGSEGRSDFGLTIYGGIERRLGPVRLEAYGQAGIVGIEEGDLFADGAARVTRRVGPIEIGAGSWGGAQPGASRLDAGPTIAAGLSIGPIRLRAAADWRFRLAGDAAPASGPALTLSAGF